MADNKDFLSQFSGEGKPAVKPESFQEEVRTEIKRPKKEIRPIQVIIPVAIVAVIALVLVIIFVMPHITVEDFTGKTQNDVAKWATQYNIDKSGIIFNEEYSLDYDDGIIISQEPSSGKVTKKAKMTFVISKGPDPDEKVTLPDIENMTKSEIQAWIDENHLLSTKISSVYDDAVPEGNVVKVDYTNIDKDNFTRGTSLKITVSKGEQPANQVTVKDYTKKIYSDLESWAKTNSITLDKTEVFSDTVESGYIVSQNPSSGRIAQNKTMTVTVSKGKGTQVPDFTKMNETEFNEWKTEHSAFTVAFSKTVYDDSTDQFILDQTVKAGTMIGTTDGVYLTKNLGDGFFIKDAYGSDPVGDSYDKFKEWAENKAAEIGLDIDTHKNPVNSDKAAGTILAVYPYHGSTKYSAIQKLPLEVEITCDISNGSTGDTTIKDYKLIEDDVKKLVSETKDISYETISSWASGHAVIAGMLNKGDKFDEPGTIDTSLYYSVDEYAYKDSYGNIIYEKIAVDNVIPKNSYLVLTKKSS